MPEENKSRTLHWQQMQRTPKSSVW